MQNIDYNENAYNEEDESFLAEIPVNILISSIETQFDEPLDYRKKDYIQSFIKKYDVLKDNTTEDFIADVENMHDEFFQFISDIFYRKLGIGFSNFNDMSDDDLHELVHMTYRFFLKNIKKNFVNIVKNYINDNESAILANFERRKDVTAINFKAEINDEYDVLVLSELGNIINFIFNEVRTMNIDEFFTYCDNNEPNMELEYVKNAFDNFELTGNFIDKYIDMLTPDFEVEIQSKIRNNILKKYPKREKKIDIQEEEPENAVSTDSSTETK